MRSIVAVVLLFSAFGAAAVDRTWPGAAPCNGTLQACINAAGSDRVSIATNTPIDEFLLVAKSLTLQAAVGYSPRMAEGRSLIASSPPGESFGFTVDGLTFQRGSLRVFQNQPFLADITLRRIQVLQEIDDGSPAILIESSVNAQFFPQIQDSRVNLTAGSGSTAAGISVRRTVASTQSMSALVAFNRVNVVDGSSRTAIEAVIGEVGSLLILNNRVSGSVYRSGISASHAGASGSPFISVIGNVISGQAGTAANQAAIDVAGRVTGSVLNNTIVDNARGISLRSDAAGAMGGAVENNLIAFNAVTGLSIDPISSVSNQRNLVHANGANTFAAGAGTLLSNPGLAQRPAPWLTSASPAIDAGSNTRVLSLTALDTAGLRRLKGASVDIGAVEYGDFSFVQQGPVADNLMLIETPPAAAGLTTSALPQVTLNMNPRGSATMVGNAHNTGLYLFGSQWTVYNEDVQPMPAGVAFNVFRPGTAAGASGFFTGTANTSRVSIPPSIVPANFVYFVLATHHYNGHGSGGFYNDHPLATSFNTALVNWQVVNTDNQPMQPGLGFNIYSQAVSPQAFVHEASAANTVSNYTLIDHPLLNGQPCALITVGRSEGGTIPIGTMYSAAQGRHAIANQAPVIPIAGSRYFVLVDEAQIAADCGSVLFANGFE